MAELVLASGSPRRQELLGRLGVVFTVRVTDVDETPRPGEAAGGYVERLARAKARAAAPGPGAVALGADTAVEVDGAILGKPVDPSEAVAMLTRLSGRTHTVHTGVALAGPGIGELSQVITTDVTFRPLTPDEIDAYVATGEPLDKAGGYGIQGQGGRFVTAVAGSLSNVVGLPLAQTAALLTRAGLPPITWGPPRDR
ncbi:MAG TPA: Maf family protein [Acidimicrobiales bacterium]